MGKQFKVVNGQVRFTGKLPVSNAEAIALSIAKWDFIYANVEKLDFRFAPDGGWQTCGLCMLHNHAEDDTCLRCPVQLTTGELFCKHTPYADWTALCSPIYPTPSKRRVFLSKARGIAMREVDFLRKLLRTKRWSKRKGP
jgi:hypothetical protein